MAHAPDVIQVETGIEVVDEGGGVTTLRNLKRRWAAAKGIGTGDTDVVAFLPPRNALLPGSLVDLFRRFAGGDDLGEASTITRSGVEWTESFGSIVRVLPALPAATNPNFILAVLNDPRLAASLLSRARHVIETSQEAVRADAELFRRVNAIDLTFYLIGAQNAILGSPADLSCVQQILASAATSLAPVMTELQDDEPVIGPSLIRELGLRMEQASQCIIESSVNSTYRKLLGKALTLLSTFQWVVDDVAFGGLDAFFNAAYAEIDECQPGVSLLTDFDPGPMSGAGPSISSDGRYIAFISGNEIFVYDDATDFLFPVAVTSHGGPPNARISDLRISGDGRWLVFSTSATDVVDGKPGGGSDVFVRDIQNGTTTRVSVARGGGDADGPSLAPLISQDGRFVAFESSASNLAPGASMRSEACVRCGDCECSSRFDSIRHRDVFLHDRDADEDGIMDERGEDGAVSTKQVSVRNDGGIAGGWSTLSGLSDDGTIVIFWSQASDIDPNGADFDITHDLFLYDSISGGVERLTSPIWESLRQRAGAIWELVQHNSPVDATFFGPASVSNDNRYVSFVAEFETSFGPTCPSMVILVDRRENSLIPLLSGSLSPFSGPVLSAAGKTLTFVGSPRLCGRGPYEDFVGVVDLEGNLEQVVVALNPDCRLVIASLDISSDGRRIVFSTNCALDPLDADATWDVYLGVACPFEEEGRPQESSIGGR